MKGLLRILLLMSVCIDIQNTCAQEKKRNRLLDSMLRSSAFHQHPGPVKAEDTLELKNLNRIANTYANDPAQIDSSIYYAKKAVSLGTELEKNKTWKEYWCVKKHMGFAYNMLGLYYKDKGDYPAALQAHFRSLDYRKGMGDKVMTAHSYNNIATLYCDQGEFTRSLEMHMEAIRIRLEMTDRRDLASSYNNIGVVYEQMEDYQKALEYQQMALKLNKELKQDRLVGMGLNNIGLAYISLKQDSLALWYYKQALKVREEIGDETGVASTLCNLTDYYSAHGDYSLAIECALRAWDLTIKTRNNSYLVRVYTSITELLRHGVQFRRNGELIDHRKIPFFMDHVINYCKRNNDKPLLLAAYRYMADYENEYGDPKKAFEFERWSANYKDTLFNDDLRKKVIRLELQNEYDKKQSQAKLEMEKKEFMITEEAKRQRQWIFFGVVGLALVSTIIFLFYNRNQIKKRLTLQRDLAEYEQKALHLQMNPHFLFNCLSSISQFISANETGEATRYLNRFARLMRLTLEHSRQETISVLSEMESLRNYLALEQVRFGHKFDFEVSASDNINDDVLIPPLLVQPFVENAILHGVVPVNYKGMIRVRFSVQQDKLVVEVKDNGVGITASKKMKTTVFPAHESRALEISNKRVAMMGENYSGNSSISMKEIVNEDGSVGGTCITLELPLITSF